MAQIHNQRTVVGTIVDVYAPRTVGKEDHTVVNFTVAMTPSVKDGDGWKDGETEFIRCTAWRKLADNVVESFNKGDRAIVIGRQTMEAPREDRDGNTVDARPNLTADFVGVDLTWDAAHSEREAKNKTSAQSEDSDGGSSKKKASNPSSKKNKKDTKPAKKDSFDDDDDIFGDDDDDIFGDD